MDKSKIAGLKQRAQIVQNANTEGENTAERVGSLLYDMIDYDRAQSDAITEVENRINNLPASGVQRVDVQQIVKQGNGVPIANVVVDGDSKTIYAPAGGGPGEKTIVSVSNTLSNGKTIGVVHVDNAEYTLKAPETGGSDVEVTPEYNSGTKIATITVDGEDNAIYVPNEITPTPTPGGGVQSVEITNVYDEEDATFIGTLNVDGKFTDLYAPSGDGGDEGGGGKAGCQRTYFCNISYIDSSFDPETDAPTASDYVEGSGNNYFSKDGRTWTVNNLNVEPGYDTWMLFVWFNNAKNYTRASITSIGIVKVLDGRNHGSNGEDGASMEWIYLRTDGELTDSTIAINLENCTNSSSTTYRPTPGTSWPSGTTRLTWADEDVVPNGWTDNPQGITSKYTHEYAAFRVSSVETEGANKGKRKWGDTGFVGPILWAKWGDKGIDGDGVEYIFCVDDNDFTNGENPAEWKDTYKDAYQVPEFIPVANKGEADNITDIRASKWFDEPVNMKLAGPGSIQWMSMRKYDGVAGEWGPYTAPKIWTYYPLDGVANGYIVDLSNENMPVGTDNNGYADGYKNSTLVQVYHNGVKMQYTDDKSDVVYGSNYFTIDTLPSPERSGPSKSKDVSGFTIKNDNGEITVNIDDTSSFADDIATLAITVLVPGDSLEASPVKYIKTLTMFGVAVGEAGQTLDLYVSASSVQSDFYCRNVDPSEIEVGVRIGKGNNVSLHRYNDEDYRQFDFKYIYRWLDNKGNWNETPDEQPVVNGKITVSDGSEVTRKSIIVRMYKTVGSKSVLVDSETIHYIRQGAPGIGINAITYGINILSNSLIVDQDTNKVSGSLSFNITRRGANASRAVEYFTNSNFHAYWVDSESNEEQENLNESDIDEAINYCPIVNINGEKILNIWLMQDGKTTFTVKIDNKTLSTTNPFASIILQTNTSMLLASVVVPFAFKGLRGDSSQVQALTGIVTRFRNWDILTSVNSDGMGDIGIGKVPSDGGVVYQDIILHDGEYYYLPMSYKGSLTPSVIKNTNVPGTADSNWIHIAAMGDAAFQQLIARNGYFDNLTAKDIVVVDTNDGYKPVAGMTSGTAVKVTVNNGTQSTYQIADRNNEDNVRIWAGYSSTTANLYDSKFYVTEKGYLHAENADISGKITATDGTIGGFKIGSDYIGNANGQLSSSADFYLTKNGAYYYSGTSNGDTTVSISPSFDSGMIYADAGSSDKKVLQTTGNVQYNLSTVDESKIFNFTIRGKGMVKLFSLTALIGNNVVIDSNGKQSYMPGTWNSSSKTYTLPDCSTIGVTINVTFSGVSGNIRTYGSSGYLVQASKTTTILASNGNSMNCGPRLIQCVCIGYNTWAISSPAYTPYNN